MQHDGFIGVAHEVGKVKNIFTVVDASTVRVRSLARFFDLCVEYNIMAEDINIYPKDEDAVISIAVSPGHGSAHDVRAKMMKALREAGIVLKPIQCNIVLPIGNQLQL